MSHNSVTVDGIAPDSTGDLPIKVENLSDTLIRPPSNGISLRYNDNKWLSAGKPIHRTPLFSWIARNSFSMSLTPVFQTGDLIVWRDAQILIRDTSAVSLNDAVDGQAPFGAGNWFQSLALSGSALNGKKLLFESVPVNRNVGGSDYMRYHWGVGTSASLATYTPIGNLAEQTPHYTQTAWGVYTMGASDVHVGLKVESLSGTINVMSGSSTTGAYHSYLQISILE